MKSCPGQLSFGVSALTVCLIQTLTGLMGFGTKVLASFATKALGLSSLNCEAELLPALAVHFSFLVNIPCSGKSACDGAAADKITSIAYLFEVRFLENFKETL